MHRTLRSRGTLVAAALLLASFSHVRLAHAATPATLTVTPSSGTLTFSTTLAGAGTDGSTCTEGVSCDTLVLTVAAGDYTGHNLRAAIDWLVPADDFDLFAFRDRLGGPLAGASNGPAPGTHEEFTLTLNGVLATQRRYVLHVVASTAALETVQGTIGFVLPPQARTALSAGQDLVFSPNVTVLAPGSPRDCEPSLRVDTRGNAYVGGIRGVPAGIDVWRFDLDPASPTFDPQLRAPSYLGQPDAFALHDTLGGKDGGGDIDIATSFPASPSATPYVTIVSLAAADVSSAVSSDRGDHFGLSPAVADVPADDRQWIEADGDATVYQMYRAPIPSTALWVQRSDDHGVSWGTPALVNPTDSTPGSIDVDHVNHVVYVSHTSSNAVFVSHSSDGGTTWTTRTVDNSMSHGNLFDPVKVGDDGTVYVAWSDGAAIWLAHSTDQGNTWSAPVKVNGPESQVALFPWLEAGSAGRVVLVWFGTSHASNDDGADWRVYAAITTNATATNPAFHRGQVSDHVVHASNISLGGLGVDTPLTPQQNRNLCDYFQVAIDPSGACVVAFTDDHNDFDGHTYLARQLAGPAMQAAANGGSGELPGDEPIPLPQPDPSSPELVDFLHDATGSTLQPIPTDNPFDLTSVDYGCFAQGATAMLEVRFRVSDLTALPQDAFYRAYFSVNAPGGVADRGQQFYLQAATSGGPAPSFTFGSVERATNGGYTLASLGTATSGEVDNAQKEIVVRLALATLNTFVSGPSVQPGTVLVGLKASTGTSGETAARDVTRGGGSFTVCGNVLAVEPPASATAWSMSAPRPNPSHGAVAVDLTLDRPRWVELGVFDASGRRVRTLRGGVLAAGLTHVLWDGRADSGRSVAAGAYWMRAMMVDGRAVRERVVFVR